MINEGRGIFQRQEAATVVLVVPGETCLQRVLQGTLSADLAILHAILIVCPATACHETLFRTETDQLLWTGLISCYSRWRREQGHSVVCSLTARVPTDLPQTLEHTCTCVLTCLFMTVGGCFQIETILWRVGQDAYRYSPLTSRKKSTSLTMWIEKKKYR